MGTRMKLDITDVQQQFWSDAFLKQLTNSTRINGQIVKLKEGERYGE